MTHWWLPGIVSGCFANIEGLFTAEPDRVTCPVCLDYVKVRAMESQTTLQAIGQRVRDL